MKIRHYIASFICLLFTWSFAENAQAAFLENCVKSFDFGGNSGVKAVEVLPVNKTCHKRCESECNALSRKTGSIPGRLPGESTGGTELNQGPILDCIVNCKSGLNVPYVIRQDLGSANIQYTRVSIGSVCETENFDLSDASYDPSRANTNAQRSGFMVTAGNRVSVSLAGSNQKVYLCGKKIMRIVPTIGVVNANDWSNSTSQTVWRSKGEHTCYMNYTDAQWNALRNTGLWATTGQDLCSWHARNPNYVNTGIYVQDGDELAIAWAGDFALDAQSLTRRTLFTRLMDPNANHSGIESMYELTGRLYIKPPSAAFTSLDADIMYGEKTRPGSDTDYLQALKNIGKKVSTEYLYDPARRPDVMNWHTLQGFVNDLYVTLAVVQSAACDTEAKRGELYNECHTTTDPGMSSYVFSGKLAGFSSARTSLAIKHPDAQAAGVYVDNTGGYDVTIDWGGCLRENGQNLEYGIFSEGRGVEWATIPDNILFGDNKLDIATTGELVFRIRPLPSPSTDPAISSLYTPANYFGSYMLFLSKPDDSGYVNNNGPFRKIVSLVYKTLYGDSNGTITRTDATTGTRTTVAATDGVVEKLYNSLVRDSKLINSILGLLTLYLTFLGIGFIIGTIEIKQQDLIIRMVKIAFVIAVISPGSWEFYYENYLSGIVFGGAQLISYVVMGSLKNTAGLTEELIQEDPTLLFVIFDGVWVQFVDKTTWTKIAALLTMGFMGIFVMFMIIMSILFCALAIVKAALAYMMSLVIISILLFAAPIFIPMMLFQFTKSIFDNWWKMLISYMLQPVGLFTGLAIFNILFAATLYVTLSYTVCDFCFFGFEIPTHGFFCLIPWWQAMVGLFNPDGVEPDAFTFPPGMFASSILLLIIAHGMLKYCDFVTKVIGSIVSGDLTSRNQDVSSYSGQAAGMAVGAANATVRAVPMAVQNVRLGAYVGANKFKEGFMSKAGGDDKGGKGGGDKGGGK